MRFLGAPQFSSAMRFSGRIVGKACFGDGWNVTTGEASIHDNLPSVAHSGVNALDLNLSTGLNTITQTLTTTPGETYTIS